MSFKQKFYCYSFDGQFTPREQYVSYYKGYSKYPIIPTTFNLIELNISCFLFDKMNKYRVTLNGTIIYYLKNSRR